MRAAPDPRSPDLTAHVGEEHVDPTELGESDVGERLHAVGIGQVGGNDRKGTVDRRGASADQDLRAGVCQRPGRGGSDAAGAAGHQRPLT